MRNSMTGVESTGHTGLSPTGEERLCSSRTGHAGLSIIAYWRGGFVAVEGITLRRLDGYSGRYSVGSER